MIAKLTQADRKWVDDTLNGMTVREKIGQILAPRLTRNSAAPLSVKEWVEKYQMGAGHVFGGSLEETRRLVAEAQGVSKVPMLISGDLERGVGQRVGGTEFAGQLALGAADDVRLARRMGEAIAVEGLAVGFNWVFGPVVDLSLDPDNLGHIRMLGSDPEQVSRLTKEIVQAIQKKGMAATAKHFPGAGTDDLDSHLTTAVNHQSKREWRRLSARPFQAAIDAGVWSVMAAPKACPAVDPECGDMLFPRPVMTSRHMLEGVLRKEMGFEGLIVTDAVTMGGLTMHFRRLEMLLACMNAGADSLLFVRRLDSVIEYFEKCLADGSLKEERLEQAARRVLELKARVGLHRGPAMMNDADAAKTFATTPYGADAERLAERSITLVRDRANVVPMKLGPGVKVGSVLVTNRPEFQLATFDGTLREMGCEVTSIKNPADPEELYDRVERGEWDALVVSLYYPPQWGWSTGRCHGPESRCMMSGFPFASEKVRPVFISWANPYHLYEFAFMDPYLNAYGGCPGTQRAMARALGGEIAIVGKSPVGQEPFFRAGDGVQRRKRRR